MRPSASTARRRRRRARDADEPGDRRNRAAPRVEQRVGENLGQPDRDPRQRHQRRRHGRARGRRPGLPAQRCIQARRRGRRHRLRPRGLAVPRAASRSPSRRAPSSVAATGSSGELERAVASRPVTRRPGPVGLRQDVAADGRPRAASAGAGRAARASRGLRRSRRDAAHRPREPVRGAARRSRGRPVVRRHAPSRDGSHRRDVRPRPRPVRAAVPAVRARRRPR